MGTPSRSGRREGVRSIDRVSLRPLRRTYAATPPSRAANPLRQRLTQAERTALSDSRMLAAAVDLISERGTSNTTLKDVGELAGYSRGLASSRFGAKDRLFFELLDQFNRRWKEASDDAVKQQTGLEALRCANKALIHFFQTEAKFIRVMYLIAYETVGSSILMREQLAGQHEAYRHGVARWIRAAASAGELRKGISPERVAVQYCAAVFGIIYQWLVSPDAVNCIQALDDLRENTIRSIAA